MDKHPLINTLFANPIWIVLDYLLQNPDCESSDAEISRAIQVVKKSAVNISLRKLAEIGLVERTRRGQMVFNKLLHTPLITELKITSNLIHLQPFVDSIAPNCSKIILFGSRADGFHETESDFDLFVVTSNFQSVQKKLNMKQKIQLVNKTPEQMLSIEKDEPILYKEIKKGIVLWEKI